LQVCFPRKNSNSFVVEYLIRGDFWLPLVLFLLIPIIISLIKACVSSSPVQVSKHYLLYILFLMKWNSKIHEIV
jgi:hypothetical protein